MPGSAGRRSRPTLAPAPRAAATPQVAGGLELSGLRMTAVNRGATLLALATRTRLIVVPLGEAAAAGAGGATTAQAVVLWPPAGWAAHPNNTIGALQWSPDGRKLLALLDNWQPFAEVCVGGGGGGGGG